MQFPHHGPPYQPDATKYFRTINRYGKGRHGGDQLVERACRHAGLELRHDLPRGVEAVARGEYQFLISHLDRPVEIGLGAKRLDLLTGRMVGPRAVLAPRDALVLRRAPDRPA